MKCRQVKELIRAERHFADGLSAPDQSALEQHLAECPACMAYQQRERAFDAAVRPVMVDVNVPAGLSGSILWEMRRARRARQRTWALCGSIAAAAVLFIAVSVGWYLARPYDLVSLYNAVEWADHGETVAQYDVASKGLDGLQPWLRRHGFAVPIPQRLISDRIVNAYLIRAGGRVVPVLEMREGPSLSRVLLLERRYFNDFQRRRINEEENLATYVIADDPESFGLGWMIIDQGTVQQFVYGEVPESGY